VTGTTRTQVLPAWSLRFGIRVALLVDVAAASVALTLTGRADRHTFAIVAGTVALYAAGGLYASRLSLSLLDDLPALVGRAAVATAGVYLVGDLAGHPTSATRTVIGSLAAVSAVCLGRGLFYAGVRQARRRRLVEHRTLIIGAGGVGRTVAGKLAAHPEYGLRPVGFCDARTRSSAESPELPVLGAPPDLSSLLTMHRITVVIVAFSQMRDPETVEILRTCDRLRSEIFIVPRLFEMLGSGAGVDQVWGLPLIRLRRPTYRTVSWRLKRVVDVAVSAVALGVLSPVLFACAVAVWIETGRGVLFRQERVGLDGRPFQLLKFRTLRPSTDAESETLWSVVGDQRVGRVGRFLRQTSLDELPQLVNILRGDMSLVGPRPERPYFVDEFTRTFPRYAARHRVPAGLTGLSQVHGLRGDTSIAERADFDNAYIEGWSMWADVKILLRTVSAIVRRRGG
jgi:exopolysaccharide biosynthesis polyprenyl glycosylphosphotransferase